MDEFMYEYVVTDGPGTLIKHGVCYGVSQFWGQNDLEGLAFDAANEGHSVQFERCDPDCLTGL